jgi:hypothetical protein
VSQDLEVLRRRVERFRMVRLPLSVATGVTIAGARWSGSPVLLWVAVVLAVALIVVRLLSNAVGNDYAAKWLGDVPATPARIALKKRIDALKTVQLVLVVLSVPCIAVCVLLRAPQAVTLACVAPFVVGMLAGVHRQSLLNSYYAPQLRPHDAGSAPANRAAPVNRPPGSGGHRF